MDIYVDGSTVNPKTMKQRSGRRRAKQPGSGFAVVTPSQILMKSYPGVIGTYLMEVKALITAVQMAEAGDVVYTDQGTLVDCIIEHGDPTHVANPGRTSTTNHIMRTQLLRAMKKSAGVTIAYYSSKETKKLPCGHYTRLADYFAAFASGSRTKHVLTYKGDREVIAL